MQIFWKAKEIERQKLRLSSKIDQLLKIKIINIRKAGFRENFYSLHDDPTATLTNIETNSLGHQKSL